MSKHFEKLSLREQNEVVVNSPFQQKGELILHSHSPVSILGSFSPEEFYLIYRETEAELIPEIISYVSLPYLVFISDWQCWKHDRIDKRGFMQWLEYLLGAGIERLSLWLRNCDFELLVAAFKHYIRIIKAIPEEVMDEIFEDRPIFTLDDSYYILCRTKSHFGTVKKVIELLFREDRVLYFNLMEAVISEIDSEIEEDAYQLRQGRLSERGFPEKEEAYRIYRKLSREELEHLPRKEIEIRGDTVTDDNAAAAALPNYPRLWGEDPLFLDDVLLLLVNEPLEVMEHIKTELMWLSNKVIVCKQAQFFDQDLVKGCVETARGYLSIGLEDLSEGRIKNGLMIIKRFWLEDVFRWGFSKIVDIRGRVCAMIHKFWGDGTEEFLAILDHPYRETLRQLLKRVPQYFDSSAKKNEHARRDFRTRQEVVQTSGLVEEVAAVLEAVRTADADWRSLMPPPCSGAFATQPGLSTVITTLFARYVLSKEIVCKPLTPQEVTVFLKGAFTGSRQKKHIKDALKHEFLHVFSENQARSAKLQPLVEHAFFECERELGKLAAKESANLKANTIASLRICPDTE